MGLFSSKKKIYVDSVAYNMAGDLAERPNYLKTVVSRNLLRNSTAISLGEEIVQAQLNGPMMDQKGFFRWARNNFPLGKMSGGIYSRLEVDPVEFANQLSLAPDQTVTIHSVFVDGEDIAYFAEKYILDNRPVDFHTDWIVDYDRAGQQIVIQYPDLSLEAVPLSTIGVITNSPLPTRESYVIGYYTVTTTTPDPVDPMAPPTVVDEFKMLLYKENSGIPEFDALIQSQATLTEFFPIIPLRLDNVSVRHPNYESIYPDLKKAYRKAIGKPIDEILDSIEDNDKLEDIDYAFLVHGVEINTAEKHGKRYIYEFLRNLAQYQTMSPVDFANWLSNPDRSEPGVSAFRTYTNNTNYYDVRISWVTVDETYAAGLGRPGAVKGDMWFTINPDITFPAKSVWDPYNDKMEYIGGGSFNHITLFWQHEDNTFRKIDAYGLTHQSYIYEGQTVEISATEGLQDPDESGFIFPLHFPTLEELPLIVANQLSISNRFVVFNCYKVVKIRWYQRGIFKILAAVVIGAVTGFLFPGGVGLLGSNIAVGTSLGLTGVAAAIAGGVANALVAMVLSTVISTAAGKLFGDKFGGILAGLISFIAFQVAASFLSTGTFSFDWGSLMKADNLLKLTSSVAGGVQRFAQAKIGEIGEELGDLRSDYESQMEDIEKRTLDLLGYGGGLIDPLLFLQMQDNSVGGTESSKTFLRRTLMTGSDIAELSFEMIYDFPKMSLDLSNPITVG